MQYVKPQANAFDRPTLARYYEVSRAAYRQEPSLAPAAQLVVAAARNPAYWGQLFEKFRKSPRTLNHVTIEVILLRL